MNELQIISKLMGPVVLSTILMTSATADADERRCQCKFSKPPYEAFGTRAACTAYLRKTSCEIEFGGLGADQYVVSKYLNVDPAGYESLIFRTLNEYLAALQQGNFDYLTDPSFIQRAIPLFMRGALFRESMIQNAQEIMEMNSAIDVFFKEHSDRVSRVFRGESEPFTQTLSANDVTFSVADGTVTVEYKDSRLVTVFIPES